MEYAFSFTEAQLQLLSEIERTNRRIFLGLVCVKDSEICCLRYAQLLELIERRQAAKGFREDQYVILVTVPKGKGLRVYINAPGVRKKFLGKELIINRNAFPNALFEPLGSNPPPTRLAWVTYTIL